MINDGKHIKYRMDRAPNWGLGAQELHKLSDYKTIQSPVYHFRR